MGIVRGRASNFMVVTWLLQTSGKACVGVRCRHVNFDHNNPHLGRGKADLTLQDQQHPTPNTQQL
jgi:hypothetical protein